MLLIWVMPRSPLAEKALQKPRPCTFDDLTWHEIETAAREDEVSAAEFIRAAVKRKLKRRKKNAVPAGRRG